MPLRQGDWFYYLVGPYSHPDPLVRLERARQMNRIAADLMAKGYLVFSPLSHGHPICTASGNAVGSDWEAWKAFNKIVLEHPKCKGVILVRLPGWQASKGLQEELAINKALGRKVVLAVEPEA